jgi:methylmalonyl-CoA mutase
MSSVLTPPEAIDAPLATALAEWRRTVEAELKGAPLAKRLTTRTAEGIALAPLYTRADLNGLPDLDSVPGEAPGLRGFRTATGWRCAQEVAGPGPAEYNAALLEGLAGGIDAVALPPDEATRCHHDPDTASPWLVGRGGVGICDRTDAAAALSGVALDCVPLWVDAGAEARPLAAILLAATEGRDPAWAGLTGGIVADPLAAWVRDGTLAAPLDECWAGAADWTRWAMKHAPGLKTLGVDATVIAEAGGNAVQELAFALAAAVETVRALEREALPLGATASHLRFRFSAGAAFFTEIAKLRAFRPLWTRVLAAYGLADLAPKAEVHARTGGWTRSVLDPHVNLLRGTTAACAAVVGGCDALHVTPFEENSGTADRLARNLHALLADEFHFAATVDPAGGAWYLEHLTDALARAAWALFQEIEEQGGCAAALRSGDVQRRVLAVAEEKRLAVANRRCGLVGVNLFPNLKESPAARCGVPQAFVAGRAREVAARRPKAPGPLASFDAMLAAARGGATIGQIATAMARSPAGEPAVTPLRPGRVAEGFERLRAAAERHRERTGGRPRVFLAKMGPVAQHKARAEFSGGFFAVGGFDVIAGGGFEDAEAAVVAATTADAPVAVLCSTDATYPVLAPAFARGIKARNPACVVVVAGLPADPAVVEACRAAGVDEFIHLRANAEVVLAGIQKTIGVLA